MRDLRRGRRESPLRDCLGCPAQGQPNRGERCACSRRFRTRRQGPCRRVRPVHRAHAGCSDGPAREASGPVPMERNRGHDRRGPPALQPPHPPPGPASDSPGGRPVPISVHGDVIRRSATYGRGASSRGALCRDAATTAPLSPPRAHEPPGRPQDYAYAAPNRRCRLPRALRRQCAFLRAKSPLTPPTPMTPGGSAPGVAWL